MAKTIDALNKNTHSDVGVSKNKKRAHIQKLQKKNIEIYTDFMGQCLCCVLNEQSQGSGICDVKVIQDDDGAARFVWLKIDVDHYEYKSQGCCWKTMTHREFKLAQHISVYETETLQNYYQIVQSLPNRIGGRKPALDILSSLLGLK